MKSETSFLVCKKIEYMFIQPNSITKCFDCGTIVGITKASEEAFEKAKNKHYLCVGCFQKRELKFGDKIAPITKKQKKELVDYLNKVTP